MWFINFVYILKQNTPTDFIFVLDFLHQYPAYNCMFFTVHIAVMRNKSSRVQLFGLIKPISHVLLAHKRRFEIFDNVAPGY